MSYVLAALFLTLVMRWGMAYLGSHAARVSDGDVIGHLTYVKAYYRRKGKTADVTNQYILDGKGYPNGLHKLLYYLRIPIPFLEKYGGYFPTLMDCLLLGLCAFAMEMFGGEHMEWLLAFPLMRTLYGNVGRSCHLSERAYGGFFGNLTLFGVMAYYLQGNDMYAYVAAASFVIFSISSKFTWQAVVFYLLGLTVVTGDVYFVASLIGMMFVAVILSRGYAWEVLKGLVRHSYFYATYLSPRNPALRNNYAELLPSRPLRAYVESLYRNSVLRIITDVPLMLIFAALLFYENPALSPWHYMVLIGVALVLLIATKPLKFLGEPERYLEYTLLPLMVVLSFYAPADWAIWCVLAAILAVMVLALHMVHHCMRNTQKQRAQEEDMIALREFCSSLSGMGVSVPTRLSFFIGYENQDMRFVTLFSNIAEGDEGKKYRAMMPDRYQFMPSDVAATVNVYGISYIISHKPSLALMEGERPGYYATLNDYPLLYENGSYEVRHCAPQE